MSPIAGRKFVLFVLAGLWLEKTKTLERYKASYTSPGGQKPRGDRPGDVAGWACLARCPCNMNHPTTPRG